MSSWTAFLVILILASASLAKNLNKRDVLNDAIFNIQKTIQDQLNLPVIGFGGFGSLAGNSEEVHKRTGTRRPVSEAAQETKEWYEGPNSCLTVEKSSEVGHERPKRGFTPLTASTSFSASDERGTFTKSCNLLPEEYTCKIERVIAGIKTIETERRNCCAGFQRQEPDGYCREIAIVPQ